MEEQISETVMFENVGLKKLLKKFFAKNSLKKKQKLTEGLGLWEKTLGQRGIYGRFLELKSDLKIFNKSLFFMTKTV